MISRDTCFLTLVLVPAFIIVSIDARSWDVAVAIGQKIDYFSRNGTRVGQSDVAEAEMLMGLAYDSKTKTMYMSDGDNENVIMYSSNLTEELIDPTIVLKNTDGAQIMAIAFDPVNRSLFWTDAQNRVIKKMAVPSNGNDGFPEVLHNLTDHNPFGIALDICNSSIYWSSCKGMGECTITRSKLDGTDSKIIVDINLYDVLGLAIDHSARKLYWLDDTEGHKFSIEYSNLDGTDRKLFFNSTHHQPMYIAVDNDSVYWTDRTSEAVWKMDKNRKTGDQPEEFRSYSTSRSSVKSIITRDNIGDINCSAISKRREKDSTVMEEIVKSVNNITTSNEEINSTIQIEKKKCLNGGRYVELTASCVCKEGFLGSSCEIFVCHNHCVHGNCHLDSKGLPKCDCGNSYTGDRCEKNICDGYCMNNGNCHLDSEGLPKCDCGNSYTGDRCEKNICDGYCMNNGTCSVSGTTPSCKCNNSLGSRCEYTSQLDRVCSLYCTKTEDVLNSFGLAFCKCSQLNETLPDHLIASTESLLPSTIILSGLVVVIVALIIIVGVLSYHVSKLKRRPRIRKRFVVSKGGVTPLTSRPQVPADSCEITIENCCNMNICETPCFEPKLRTTPTKSSSTKKEEKNSLLDSMEGADSC